MSHQPAFRTRQLFADDLATFRKLLDVFGQVFDEPATYSEAQPGDEYLRSRLRAEDFIVLAAETQPDVIGGLVAYELKKFEQARSEIYIYDLGVSEAHRRKGVATSLIEKLKEIARARGAYVIYVQADLIDEPAIALYSKLGKREDVLHFDIAVT